MDVEKQVEKIGAYYNSPENLTKNLTRPLVSQDALTTFDGKSFDAKIGCKSSKKFLEVMVKPGKTGDIAHLLLQQDTNLDGKPDFAYQAPFIVSGVCANGVMSCSPGTWSNCRSYLWQSNAQNRIGLVEAPRAKLGGCYCFNQSCGNGLLLNNLLAIVSDIGSGAASELAKKNPNYAISEVNHNEHQISFYGQTSADCKTGDHSLSQHYAKPDKLINAAFTSKDTHEVFNAIVNSPAAQNIEAQSQHTCRIERLLELEEISLDELLEVSSGSGQLTRCGSHCLQLLLGAPHGESLKNKKKRCRIYTFNTSLNIHQPERIHSAILNKAQADEVIQFFIDDEFVYSQPIRWEGGGYPYDCDISTSVRTPNLDLTSYFQNKSVNLKLRVAVERKGKGEGHVEIPIVFDSICEIKSERIHNTCSALEKNPDCTLKEERVDGVTTFSNHVGTGLTPLPQTRLLVGENCKKSVKRDWFEKIRVYQCQKKDAENINQGLSRYQLIKNSTTETHYKDIRPNESGLSVSFDEVLNLPKTPSTPSCTKVCKTKKPRKVALVGKSTLIANNAKSSRSWDFAYHTCQKDVCPKVDDELMVKPCGCIDEFSEAASIMQIMRSAGQDLICSSGSQNNPLNMQVNDGKQNMAGDCLGKTFVFSGRALQCRTPGLQTAYKDCCDYDEKAFTDSTGSITQSVVKTKVIAGTYKAMKSAFVAYKAAKATGATIQAASTAASQAASQALLAAFSPMTLAATAVVLLITEFLAKSCEQEDIETAALKASKYCVLLGKVCTKKVAKSCVQKAKSLCCFNSKLARIIHEQGREQLKNFQGFGSKKNPECRGFTPEEFQSLDFSKLDLSEYYQDLRRNAEAVVQNNIEGKIKGFYEKTLAH